MRKKLLVLLYIFACCLLSGCGNTVEKRTVTDTYHLYAQMYEDVWLGASEKAVDGSVCTLKGVGDYMELNDTVTSIEQIEEKTEQTCTKEYAQTEFYDKLLNRETPYFYEQDGIMYLACTELPGLITGEIKDIEILEKKADYIHARIWGEDFALGETITDIVLVKQDGVWKVDSLESDLK